MPALDRLGLTKNARVLVIFRISCAALATFWKEVEVWFAWLSRSRNCSGFISHGPRCRPRHRRTCRTTYPLSARPYKVDMARKKEKRLSTTAGTDWRPRFPIYRTYIKEGWTQQQQQQQQHRAAFLYTRGRRFHSAYKTEGNAALLGPTSRSNNNAIGDR